MNNKPFLIPVFHRFEDARGRFTRTYEAVAGFELVEENESWNAKAGTIRGLHWQEPAQAKIVRVLKGSIFDVCVRLSDRAVFSFTLSESDGASLYVPEGFAHGFCTLEDETRVLYKVNAAYAPGAQFGLNAFDPALGIAWPVDEANAIMSEKDRALPRAA